MLFIVILNMLISQKEAVIPFRTGFLFTTGGATLNYSLLLWMFKTVMNNHRLHRGFQVKRDEFKGRLYLRGSSCSELDLRLEFIQVNCYFRGFHDNSSSLFWLMGPSNLSGTELLYQLWDTTLALVPPARLGKQRQTE